MNHCPHCGAALEEHARYCTYCMTTLTDKQFIANPIRISARLLTLLTAAFLMLVCALSVCAFLLYPPQDQPSDSTIRRPSHPLSSQAVIFAQDNSSQSLAQESESSDPFFDVSSFLNESSSSESFSASSQSQTSPSSALSSQSSEKPSAPPSSNNSSSSVSDNWGSRLFPFSAPADFESYTILLEKTTHWRDNYSFTGNAPEIAESIGVIGEKSVFAVGFQKPPTDTRYYIPETINGYTVTGLAIDEGRGAGYSTFRSYAVTNHMKEIYCPPSCRFLDAFNECEKLTDIYIAADSFYMDYSSLPHLECAPGHSGCNDEAPTCRLVITIHAKPDAWNEYAGMTMAEYMSDPNNKYHCRFEAWDPSTVY